MAAGTACAAPTSSLPPEVAPGPTPASEVIATGGDLEATTLPGASVERRGDFMVVVGSAEAPADARLQLAYAMAEAVARSEIMQRVQVAVASLAQDVASSDGAIDVSVVTAQASAGLLPGLPPAKHGWAKVRRSDEVILIVVARYDIPMAAFDSTFAQAFAGVPSGTILAEKMRERMGATLSH